MSSSHPTTPESSKSRGSKQPSAQKSRKFMNITVYFLDDSSHVFQLQAKTLGQTLFDKVCKFINLLEVDYFGLEYEDEKGTKCWLDVLKPLCSQIPTLFPTMYFCVKFYTPDPAQLEDEFTRYLFGLQLKKDLASGLLQCNDNTTAVIISYLVQAEIGDFIPEKYTDSSYLSSHKFVPYQEGELERKIMENHKKLIGQTPAEADTNLLETARRCELYGIKMTAAKDHEGVPLNLAVAHLGVLVFQNFTKINTFSWVKIRKLSFKRKKFLIKLHPEGYGYYKDTVEYIFEGRNECKNFWKKCIENHTFFRCTDAKQGMRQKPKIFSRGSSFRYSGRTQKQVSEYVRESCFKRPPFQRSISLRTPSSPSRSVGSPKTPQPLLPVASLSCGSISDIPKDTIPAKKLSTSEPTTPLVAVDSNRSINGDCLKGKDIQGLVSPDFETDQEGFQSLDFLGQDTDDNISHDSYNVLEKEQPKTNSECMLTNNEIIVGNKSPECEVLTTLLTNGTEEHEGKFEDLPPPSRKSSLPPDTTDNMANEENQLEEEEEEESKNSLNISTSENSESFDKVENNNNTLKDMLIEKEDRKSTRPDSDFAEHVKKMQDYSNTDKNGYSTPIKVQADIERIPTKITEPPSMDSLNRLSGESKGVDSPKPDDQNSNIDDLSYQSPSDESLNIINELQQSFGSSTFYVSSPLVARLGSNKKTPTDKAYCLAKELLMTERTYRKDLEIINVVFREEVDKLTIQCDAVDEMLKIINPLYEKHCFLLRDLEQRLAFWEGKPKGRTQNGIKGVGDILMNHKDMIKAHGDYLKNLPNILELVQKNLICDHELGTFYQQFEGHKFCYLPLTSFLLRPAFRLPYYSSLLKSLLNCYDTEHEDFTFCIDALLHLKDYCETFEDKIVSIINFVKLMELQRSLCGFPNLLNKKRIFVREGCLFKVSRNGCHQHMFFLFSDTILYTTRIHNSHFRFKVQGHISTSGLKVEETEPKHGMNHCFSMSSAEKQVFVSASSEKEHLKWLRDLKSTMHSANGSQLNSSSTSSLILKSFSEDKYESSDDTDDMSLMTDEKPVSHHVNTSIHICWHRNISISSCDLLISLKHSISGYLLRKFKNNSGWQKLWIVLANLCLFFYKSYLDESPLASLPLAGYRILNTTNSDTVSGDLIFKLQFKTHEYFFMAESKHTFDRWMEAINHCTLTEEENTRL